MNTRRDTLVVALLVMGSLLACKKKETPAPVTEDPVATTTATATASAAPAPAKTFKVGEEATQLDYKIKVSEVKQCTPRYYEKASLKKAGHRLIAVEMTIESISDKPFTPGTYAMKIVDDEGLTYKYSFRGKCEPRLQTGSLNKGEKVKGWVTFEVGDKAKGLKFAYDHTTFIGPKQNVKFDLGDVPAK
ncbi:MAG: DUF4352 domain-containing protein [Myxococcales bacterium]|nr:DUF4352 domain-containing protein [Myxococcales bacterium]